MKRNQGNISNIRLVADSKNNLKRWKDSTGNYKHICLNCFKSFKHGGSCCGWRTYTISKDARPPRQTAHKSKWKQFFSLFLHGFRADKQQMKKIISIRKEYGLPTIDQEIKLKALLVEHEEKFGFFDIKRHEKLLTIERYGYNESDKITATVINSVVVRFEKNMSVDKFLNNKEYFIVPIHSDNYGTYTFPSTLSNYDIYKVRSKSIDTERNIFEFRIRTNNIDEILPSKNNYYGNQSKYAYRQDYLIFDTKEKAMAFRQEYLSVIIPVFKEHNVSFVDDLVKKSNIDYDRVLKKAPQLLV